MQESLPPSLKGQFLTVRIQLVLVAEFIFGRVEPRCNETGRSPLPESENWCTFIIDFRARRPQLAQLFPSIPVQLCEVFSKIPHQRSFSSSLPLITGTFNSFALSSLEPASAPATT